MVKNGGRSKRSKRNHNERKYVFYDQEVVRTVGDDTHTYFGDPSRRKLKFVFMAIGIIGLIAGGAVAASLSATIDGHKESQFEKADSKKVEVVTN